MLKEEQARREQAEEARLQEQAHQAATQTRAAPRSLAASDLLPTTASHGPAQGEEDWIFPLFVPRHNRSKRQKRTSASQLSPEPPPADAGEAVASLDVNANADGTTFDADVDAGVDVGAAAAPVEPAVKQRKARAGSGKKAAATKRAKGKGRARAKARDDPSETGVLVPRAADSSAEAGGVQLGGGASQAGGGGRLRSRSKRPAAPETVRSRAAKAQREKRKAMRKVWEARDAEGRDPLDIEGLSLGEMIARFTSEDKVAAQARIRQKNAARAAAAAADAEAAEAAARPAAALPSAEDAGASGSGGGPEAAAAAAAGPRVQVIDGKIVFLEESVQIQEPAVPREQFTYSRVEETYSQLNSQTYSNRTKNVKWTKEDTETFFKGLRQFGTNFELIRKLLPSRTRKQLKHKYLREDKENPDVVSAALDYRGNDHQHFHDMIALVGATDQLAPIPPPS